MAPQIGDKLEWKQINSPPAPLAFPNVIIPGATTQEPLHLSSKFPWRNTQHHFVNKIKGRNMFTKGEHGSSKKYALIWCSDYVGVA